jgi:hypothetical protein
VPSLVDLPGGKFFFVEIIHLAPSLFIGLRVKNPLTKQFYNCWRILPTGSLNFPLVYASGGQGLFLKKPPLDPAKTF